MAPLPPPQQINPPTTTNYSTLFSFHLSPQLVYHCSFFFSAFSLILCACPPHQPSDQQLQVPRHIHTQLIYPAHFFHCCAMHMYTSVNCLVLFHFHQPLFFICCWQDINSITIFISKGGISDKLKRVVVHQELYWDKQGNTGNAKEWRSIIIVLFMASEGSSWVDSGQLVGQWSHQELTRVDSSEWAWLK